MERQKARWRHAGCTNAGDCRDWVLQMTLRIVTFYAPSRLHGQFFYVAIFFLPHKNFAFQQMQLSYKNWSFLIIYTGK